MLRKVAKHLIAASELLEFCKHQLDPIGDTFVGIENDFAYLGADITSRQMMNQLAALAFDIRPAHSRRRRL